MYYSKTKLNLNFRSTSSQCNKCCLAEKSFANLFGSLRQYCTEFFPPHTGLRRCCLLHKWKNCICIYNRYSGDGGLSINDKYLYFWTDTRGCGIFFIYLDYASLISILLWKSECLWWKSVCPLSWFLFLLIFFAYLSHRFQITKQMHCILVSGNFLFEPFFVCRM